ncbi:hypothetical protein ACFPM0_24685 [Pseudonocardia sulfidoxydans]|uniref:hypothetical protein n=1 Tax=Pseudonocardia sulfidoxydans TaxID=54011 RepID=UPI0036159C18
MPDRDGRDRSRVVEPAQSDATTCSADTVVVFVSRGCAVVGVRVSTIEIAHGRRVHFVGTARVLRPTLALHAER